MKCKKSPFICPFKKNMYYCKKCHYYKAGKDFSGNSIDLAIRKCRACKYGKFRDRCTNMIKVYCARIAHDINMREYNRGIDAIDMVSPDSVEDIISVGTSTCSRTGLYYPCAELTLERRDATRPFHIVDNVVLVAKHTLKEKSAPKTSDDETYEVEEILDMRETDESTEYLVKWAGYDEDESTWEPITQLYECRKKVNAFYRKSVR